MNLKQLVSCMYDTKLIRKSTKNKVETGTITSSASKVSMEYLTIFYEEGENQAIDYLQDWEIQEL